VTVSLVISPVSDVPLKLLPFIYISVVCGSAISVCLYACQCANLILSIGERLNKMGEKHNARDKKI